jgi:diphosphomevalonate decarboxylase
MHADALAAVPGLIYWEPATIGCLHAVRRLRELGTKAWATIDAGPHVVALCAEADAPEVERALAEVPGVEKTLVCAPAGGARVIG